MTIISASYSVLRSNIDRLARHLIGAMPWLWRDVPAVFVLSTGRTGTETLMYLLDLSEQIDAFHEPRPQLMLERKQARIEIYSHKGKYEHIFQQERGKALFNAKLKGQIYAETSARMTFFAPVIAEILPNARFIYIHRHPGDIVRSGMRRGWYVDHPADFARIEPAEDEIPYTEWMTWEPFKKICWYWDVYNRFALDFAQQIDPARILVVRASDIYNGAATASIFKVIGVPKPPSTAIATVLKKKYNKQTRADFPRYSAWSSEMKQVLHDMTSETMVRLGYHHLEDEATEQA